ncbi:MAG: UDP-N-acetylmuramate dehydrogenase [Anaerolineae bacterium]|nr:UDP-N-acetylmuramate dehydrogenase [Anaerolineae bacterium]
MSMIDNKVISDLQHQFADAVLLDQPLSAYTSVGIGGPADLLLIAKDETELEKMVQACWNADLPTIILGKGSNVLVSDKGIRGATIINQAVKHQVIENPTNPGEMTWIFSESGALLGKVSRLAASFSLTGMEWGEGVPGTIGGAVIGNAGAFGGDMSDSMVSCRILKRGEAARDYFSEEMEFSYRKSFLKENTENFVVLSAVFQFAHGEKQQIQEKMADNQAKRRKKQPATRSIGSVFKNPENDFAGRLINQLHLKGTRFGDAQISQQHANIFINVGNATANDWMHLMEFTQQKVLENYGIQLEPEILLIGEW